MNSNLRFLSNFRNGLGGTHVCGWLPNIAPELHKYQKMWNFLVHLLIYMKSRIMSTYSNAHAKVKNWIFAVQFPGNCFTFSIILNDFWSSTICGIRNQFSFAQFKNPKNPGIQPIHISWVMRCSKINRFVNPLSKVLGQVEFILNVC